MHLLNYKQDTMLIKVNWSHVVCTLVPCYLFQEETSLTVCTKHSTSPPDLGYHRRQPVLSRQLHIPANLSRQKDEPLWNRQVMTCCSQDRKWPDNDPWNTDIPPTQRTCITKWGMEFKRCGCFPLHGGLFWTKVKIGPSFLTLTNMCWGSQDILASFKNLSLVSVQTLQKFGFHLWEITGVICKFSNNKGE